MRLIDNKYITPKIAKTLERQGWTIQRLATTSIKRLTKYKNIGHVTAQRIINESRQMTNDALIIETEEMERTAKQRRTPIEAIATLESDGWTLEQIATASPDELLGYCSKKTAKEAIKIAIKRTGERKYAEKPGNEPAPKAAAKAKPAETEQVVQEQPIPEVAQEEAVEPINQQPDIVIIPMPEDDEPQGSVRVKRIKEINA